MTSDSIKDERLRFKITKYWILNYLNYSEAYIYDECGSLIIYDKLKTYLNVTQEIIDTSTCKYLAELRLTRYEVLKEITLSTYNYWNLNTVFDVISNEEKNIKYRWGLNGDDRFGLGLSAGYFGGKESWLGLEISAISYYSAPFSFKQVCENHKIKAKPSIQYSTVSFSIFTASFYQGLRTGSKDISLSLLDINSPLLIIPTRFGISFDEKFRTKHLFYKPAIGLPLDQCLFPIPITYLFRKK